MTSQPTSERLDHELKAVLVADVEGYTRLMSMDEDEAHLLTSRCLELFRDFILESDGELVKTTGDGVVIEFSAATTAVRYGIDVQKRLVKLNSTVPVDRRPNFRIGIDLGEIIHEGGDIYGHSVNIAARIEGFAEPNGICVSQIVYEMVRHRLSIGFECMGPCLLKNLDEPVTIYRVRDDLSASIMPATVRKSSEPLKLPERPSVAVLPFENMSERRDAEYLGNGIAEDIITSLSKFEELFVIARNSSFVYKGKPTAAQEIAQELGVRYIVEGSVRVAGKRMRITAQLIDGIGGHHLWAERYDRELEDIFEIQDNVTKVIVSTIASRVKLAEADRRSEMETQNIEAYGDLLHGREFLKKYTAADNAEARRYFESSLDHDPKYAPACAAMARSYNYDWQFSWGEDSGKALDHALKWARKAMALDRTSASAHAELGFNLLFNKQYESAIKELRIATKLNPNDADIMAELSDALTYTGQLDEAVELLKTAMRLNPYYPDVYLWYLADAYYALRQYDEAVDALEGMTNPAIGARLLAASYAQLGNIDNARMHAEQVLRDQPDFSVEEWTKKQPEINPAETEHLAEGLRKAGLPG